MHPCMHVHTHTGMMARRHACTQARMYTGTQEQRHRGTQAHSHTGDKRLHIHLPKAMPVGTTLSPLAPIRKEEINLQEGTAIYVDQAAYKAEQHKR